MTRGYGGGRALANSMTVKVHHNDPQESGKIVPRITVPEQVRMLEIAIEDTSGRKYVLKLNRDSLQVAANGRLAIAPQAANMILINQKGW